MLVMASREQLFTKIFLIRLTTMHADDHLVVVVSISTPMDVDKHLSRVAIMIHGILPLFLEPT